MKIRDSVRIDGLTEEKLNSIRPRKTGARTKKNSKVSKVQTHPLVMKAAKKAVKEGQVIKPISETCAMVVNKPVK